MFVFGPNRITATSVSALFSACLLACVSPAAHAQPVQPWPDVIVTVPLGDGWLVSGEAVGRIASDSNTSQSEARALIGRQITPQLAVWAGSVHYENYNPGAPNTHEDQVLEQVNWVIGTWGRFRFSTRTRLEQRFIEGVSGTNWRWRQQARVSYSFGNKLAPRAVIWMEPYFALNRSTAQTHTLDETRSFAGLNVPVSSRVEMEFGFLQQRSYKESATAVTNAIPLILTARF